jgi:hypothetical protein
MENRASSYLQNLAGYYEETLTVLRSATRSNSI